MPLFNLPSLETLQENQQLRQLKKLHGKDFCSNDYLGLSKSEELRSELLRFLQHSEALSASSSRLIPGYHHMHEEVESVLANYFGSESGLIFNSGYSANLGIISTLCKDAVIFSDELNHASLIDGIRLSRSETHIFEHNNLEQLRELLQKASSDKPRFIITESLFSMDGDFSPLDQLQAISEEFSATLIVDEAHASGVFGPKGSGRVAELLKRENIISIHTFGKAFAGFGAFVATSKNTRDLLINFCREFIFTTALPPHVVFLMAKSVDWVRKNPEWRENLIAQSESFRQRLKEQGFDLSTSQSQIIPVVLGSNEKVLSAEVFLQKQGFQVSAIRSPSVAKGSERLRICLHASHRSSELNQLFRCLVEWREKHG